MMFNRSLILLPALILCTSGLCAVVETQLFPILHRLKNILTESKVLYDEEISLCSYGRDADLALFCLREC